MAIADADPSVLVVGHSNGTDCRIYGSRAGEVPERQRGQFWDWALTQSLAGAVAFGDWDAAWAYQQIAEKCPLIWLDSYAAKSGVSPARRNWRAGLRSWNKQPLACFQGVHSATTAAIALRTAAKGGAR